MSRLAVFSCIEKDCINKYGYLKIIKILAPSDNPPTLEEYDEVRFERLWNCNEVKFGV